MSEIRAKENQVIDVLKLGGVSSIAVGETGVAYSHSFILPKGDPKFAFEYQAASEGSVKLKAELEQSNEEPATEGVADGNFVVPNDAADLDAELTDEYVHHKAYDPAATALARFKFTGLDTNDASTVISKLRVSIIK